jgi:hypothetical protein
MREPTSGVLATGAGFGTGYPIATLVTHALSVSPWHWFAPTDEAMVRAIGALCAGGATAIASGLLNRPSRPKPFDGELAEPDAGK